MYFRCNSWVSHIIHSLGLMETRTTLNTAFLSWIQTLEFPLIFICASHQLLVNSPSVFKSRPFVLKQSQPEKLVGPPVLLPYTQLDISTVSQETVGKWALFVVAFDQPVTASEHSGRSICSKHDASHHCPKKRKEGSAQNESLSPSVFQGKV